MLDIDSQGTWFVDYLGEGFQENTSNGLAPSVVRQAYRFVLSELAEFEREGDPKLTGRYQLLRDYFASRQRRWTE